VLTINGVGLVQLMDRDDGAWFARLDYHVPDKLRLRTCTSHEAGRTGA
jgi:hypothetical protein